GDRNGGAPILRPAGAGGWGARAASRRRRRTRAVPTARSRRAGPDTVLRLPPLRHRTEAGRHHSRRLLVRPPTRGARPDATGRGLRAPDRPARDRSVDGRGGGDGRVG